MFFNIPINFNFGGKYTIGIIPGTSGESNVKEVAIVSEPSSSTTPMATTASLLETNTDENGDSIFSWNNSNFQLSKIVIKQGVNKIVKIISGGQTSYTPDYTEFKNFSEGTFYWTVFLAKSSTNNAYNINTTWSSPASTESFKGVKHNFISYDKEKLVLSNQSIVEQRGARLKLEGISYEDMRPEIAVILENGGIKEYTITSSNSISHDPNLNIDIYKSPVTFSVTIPFDEKGLYFLEINSSNGLASYNAPVYVGGVIPILPDFRDCQ